ncbi:hypothetical protein MKEN_00546200 [Mycena kentingensis (nom. inval.)]|nr:hypothetical protein MKEN_00546200 [Mycena kentingensis (nom. inval.)]
MLKIATISLLYFIPLVCGAASRRPSTQSRRVCTNGLCFEQFHHADLNVTVGFALPDRSDDRFPDELIVKTVFPLPYGYVGTRLGPVQSTLVKSLLVYAAYINNKEANSMQFDASLSRAQLVEPVGTTLSPLNIPQLNSTFSPSLTNWDNGVGTYVLRCQQCSVILDYLCAASSNGQATLTTLFSREYPVYLDQARTVANLSSVGALVREAVLNVKQARFSNYSAMLEVAGLKDPAAQ